MSLPFWLIDVFAERKFAGNQLAVVQASPALAGDEMQRLAKEFHFSETAFIIGGDAERGYDVRIFTPEHEVAFAGHPTLGTAHIIHTELGGGRNGGLTLNLGVGPVPVTWNAESAADGPAVYWMRQVEPIFGKTLAAAELAPVLNLSPEDFDSRFPIEEVSTGLPHIIVPLKSLAALKHARVTRDLYFALIEDAFAKNILIFCPETHEPGNDIATRMFADYLGIAEDPATGSGNGCLAGYLAKHRFFGSVTISLRSEQGYEIDRPSLLHLRAHDDGTHIAIDVGGGAVTMARGAVQA